MTKTIIAATAVALLGLTGCASGSGPAIEAPGTPVLSSSTAEPSSGGSTDYQSDYQPDDQVVPAESMSVEDLYIMVLDDVGVRYTSEEDVILAGHVVCQFIDEGNSLSDLFLEMALDPQSARILPPVSNDDLPYVAGAAVPAFCPEYEAAVDRDLGRF